MLLICLQSDGAGHEERE